MRLPLAAVLAAALSGMSVPTAAAHAPLVAQQLVLVEWRQAENRSTCAPIAFADVGRGGWSARRATFSGGWAVAFDLPGLRSASGVAGVGSLPEDRLPDDAHRTELKAQWPHVRELPAIHGFAGYGLEGGQAYEERQPRRGENSLAYVRGGKSTCLYNVWSRLGRSHLEALLDALRPVPAG